MRNRNHSLKGLVRRLVFSLLLIIAGSWLLLLPGRGAGLVRQLAELDWDQPMFKLGTFIFDLSMLFDFVGFSLVFLGIFMSLYYRSRLVPRLRRLSELGEDRW